MGKPLRSVEVLEPTTGRSSSSSSSRDKCRGSTTGTSTASKGGRRKRSTATYELERGLRASFRRGGGAGGGGSSTSEGEDDYRDESDEPARDFTTDDDEDEKCGYRWYALPPMRVARHGCCCVALPDGRVVVAGGGDGAGADAATAACSVEIFDFATAVWSELPPMRVGRSFAGACLINRSQLIVAGGFGHDWLTLGSSETLELRDDRAGIPHDDDATSTAVSAASAGASSHTEWQSGPSLPTEVRWLQLVAVPTALLPPPSGGHTTTTRLGSDHGSSSGATCRIGLKDSRNPMIRARGRLPAIEKAVSSSVATSQGAYDEGDISKEEAAELVKKFTQQSTAVEAVELAKPPRGGFGLFA